MSYTCSDGQSLTTTLIRALSQSEALQRNAEEAGRIIDRLKRDNESFQAQLDKLRQKPSTHVPDVSEAFENVKHINSKLKQELEDVRQQQQEEAADAHTRTEALKRDNDSLKAELQELQKAQRPTTVGSSADLETLREENASLKSQLREHYQAQQEASDASAQIEQLFKQNVEKQAEIDKLKSKLHLVQSKERKWRQNNPLISSPIVSSDEPDHMLQSPRLSSPGIVTSSDGDGNGTVEGARKRQRTGTRSTDTPLREISRNLPGSVKSTKALSKLRHISDRGAEAIPIIAEDGEDHNRSRSKTPVNKENSKDVTHQRLHNLLTAPSPGRAMLSRPSTAETASASASPHLQPPLSGPRSAVAPEDEEPFRARPLRRLNLSHFRINPLHNDGNDYAYNEVIRGNARKCLEGCTKPECCGGIFRALAATLPMPADMSDDELLLGFLGPGSEDRIKSLTPLARKNLIHEARTNQVANTYGKMHRTTFERAGSPPGFWNTDMPGTQEEKENREKARLMEREEVERRYREATKDNGRWLFADE